MYKVQAEGGNQLSADHKQILLRGWGGLPPNFCNNNISENREVSLSGEQHDEVYAAQLRSSPLGHLLLGG